MKHRSQTLKTGLATLLLFLAQLVMPAQAAFAHGGNSQPPTNPDNLQQVFCNVESNSGKWKAQIGGPSTERKYPLLVDGQPVYVHDLTSTMDTQCQTEYGPQVIDIPSTPTINDPCGSGNAAWNVPTDTTMVTWSLNNQGHLIATAKTGYIFTGNKTFVDFGVAVELNTAACVTKIQKPTVPVIDPCGLGNAYYGLVPYSNKYTYVRNNDGSITFTAKSTYVFDDGTMNGTKSYTLAAPQDSGALCRVSIPHQPDTDDPCGTNNATWDIPKDTNEYTWALTQNGHLIATTTANYIFSNGHTTYDFGTAPDSNQPCPVTVVQPTCQTGGSMTLALPQPNFGKYYYEVTVGLVTTKYQENQLPYTITNIAQGSTVNVKLVRDGVVFDVVVFSKDYHYDTLNCIEIPSTPSPTDPCGPDNAEWTLPENSNSVHWSIVNGELIATAVGSLFTDGTATHNYGLVSDSNTLCAPIPPEQVVNCGLFNNDSFTVSEESNYYSWHSYWKGSTFVVYAEANDGYHFGDVQTEWEFTDTHTACELPSVTVMPKTCYGDASISIDYDAERYYYTIQFGDGDETPLDSGTTTLTEVGTYTVRGYEYDHTQILERAESESAVSSGLVYTNTFTIAAPSCEPGKGSITPLPTVTELPHTGSDGGSNLLIALVAAATVYGAVYFAQPKRA
jgi:hypothetical protein